MVYHQIKSFKTTKYFPKPDLIPNLETSYLGLGGFIRHFPQFIYHLIGEVLSPSPHSPLSPWIIVMCWCTLTIFHYLNNVIGYCDFVFFYIFKMFFIYFTVVLYLGREAQKQESGQVQFRGGSKDQTQQVASSPPHCQVETYS